MRRWKIISLLIAAGLLLSGCGKSTEEVTTITIQKDGSIEHTIIEDFEEESTDSLQDMLLTKTAEYNKNISGEGIKVDTVEKNDGTVRIRMTYPTAADFDGFMNMDVVAVDQALRAPFFYGTVEEAFSEGYDLDVMLYGVENENFLQGKDDILLMGENKIIIYDNRMNLGASVQINVPNSILYSSDNVTLAGKKLAEISDTDKLAYILLEG